jgi:hypothetical protein
MRDGQFDELGCQGFEFLAIGDGGGQRRGVCGRNALADIGPLAPDLMLEVRAGFAPGRLRPIFGFKAALLHGFECRHLLQDEGSLRVEF